MEQQFNFYSWKIASASVPGFDHLDNGVPCQDAYAYLETDKKVIICALCDGAGSAQNAELGSKVISEAIVRNIWQGIKNSNKPIDIFLQKDSVESEIIMAIEHTRTNMMQLFQCDNSGLSDFHSTLIGVVASLNGGVIFHVGDGCAFSSKFNELRDSSISSPQNGEYANETYFVTQENWKNHLRFIFFDANFDFIVLMSDGVTPFALDKGGLLPFEDFFNPLNGYLSSHDNPEASRAIKKYLEDERIRNITGDDKTFVWIQKLLNDNTIENEANRLDKKIL